MFKKPINSQQEPRPHPTTFAEQLESRRREKESERTVLEAKLQTLDEEIVGLDSHIAWLRRNPRPESVLRAVSARFR